VIVYQDQVLLIAQKFAGYTLGEADVMRKAMGKKIPAVMAAERERFLAGARANGYSEAQADQVFNLIEPFAGYAFNKAHAVCYANIAYQTAYLKANYPAEYMTAVLMLAEHHPAGAAQRVAEAYPECARLGISVLPPDVNHSRISFALEEQDNGSLAIRFLFHHPMMQNKLMLVFQHAHFQSQLNRNACFAFRNPFRIGFKNRKNLLIVGNGFPLYDPAFYLIKLAVGMGHVIFYFNHFNPLRDGR